ncbi:MAG: reverse transcriptase domain-containing protein [Candidatus Komeilibacteria bacterium]|nr:reverse transcriptase domain-containing protein [Candidatus Komeilibacteria bacterium]
MIAAAVAGVGGWRAIDAGPVMADGNVADVRDRLVHQLLSGYLNDLYEPRFYFHSYASRCDKGLNLAVKYFLFNYHRLSRSGRVWAAKLDVKKYFSNVRHDILLALLRRHINNRQILHLLSEVVGSFGDNGRGLPLGNLTSQVKVLFAL